MLKATLAVAKDYAGIDLLSVGSGLGLFERPLVAALDAQGRLNSFTGIDINEEANRAFREHLEAPNDGNFRVEIVEGAFEQYASKEVFDLIIFNHVFEYLDEGHDQWLSNALDLLRAGGRIALFSPVRDEINYYYSQYHEQHFQRSPFFADDLQDLLNLRADTDVERQSIAGVCQLSLLTQEPISEEGLKLLSFLCQINVRAFPRSEINELRDYFLGVEGNELITHRTELFLVSQAL